MAEEPQNKQESDSEGEAQYRRMLFEAQMANQRDRDKAVLYLASAALGVVLTAGIEFHAYLELFASVFFVLAIVSVLVSYHVCEKDLCRANEGMKESKWPRVFNVAATCFFVVGVCLLTLGYFWCKVDC